MTKSVFAQQDNPLFKLKKQDIIDKAEAYFQESYPDFKAGNFDRIQLNRNTKSEYLLLFSNAIEYIPLGKSHYYSAECLFSLTDKKDSLPEIQFGIKGVTKKPDKSPGIQKITFYYPFPKDEKSIKFVLKALKRNNPKWRRSPREQLILTEEKEVYKVHQKDATNSTFYIVSKSDGKVSDFLEVHEMPMDEEQWQEISW